MQPPYVFHTKLDDRIVEALRQGPKSLTDLARALPVRPTPARLRTEVLNLQKAGVVETNIAIRYDKQRGIVERHGLFGGGAGMKRRMLMVKLSPTYVEAARRFRDYWDAKDREAWRDPDDVEEGDEDL